MKKPLREGNEQAGTVGKAAAWVRGRDGRRSTGKDQTSAAGARGEQRGGEEKVETGGREEHHGANVASLVSSPFPPPPINFCRFLPALHAGRSASRGAEPLAAALRVLGLRGGRRSSRAGA